MKITEYRQEFHLYQTALARTQYKNYPQPPAESDARFLSERHADLWTRDAVEELQKNRDEITAHFETERTARDVLLGFARARYITEQTREITLELGRCEAATRLDWRGERINASQAASLIGDANRAADRHDLEARRHDALRSGDDLRAARQMRQRELLGDLGFATPGAFAVSLTGSELSALARVAEEVLTRTATAYRAMHARVASQLLGPEDASAPQTSADYLFWRRHLRPKPDSHAGQPAFQETLAGLGVRLGQLTNLRAESSGAHEAACFPLDAPREVALLAGSAATIAGRARFFSAGARAQHYAWSSSSLAERYPEFIYPNDAATNQAYGFLFRLLLQDESWQRDFGSGASREEELRATTSLFAFFDLHDVRRACAGVIFAAAVDADENPGAEANGETYAQLYTEATNFAHRPEPHLEAAENAYAAATSLRAWAFAVSLREYLRTRHGRRWWTARAAGDELIDLWSTASRYRVEELARQLGAGELGSESLAENLLAAGKSAAP